MSKEVFSAEAEKSPQIASPSSPSSATISSSTDLDDNHDLYKRHDNQTIDASESKRVLRKIDLRILPILFTIYLLQYLDKNALNFASVYGLQAGTNLHGQDFSWLGSIFYFGIYSGARLPLLFI